MLWIERAAETQRQQWLNPEYRRRMTELRAERAKEDTVWRVLCARLRMNKVACKINPHVSLPRVRFVDDQYKPQQDSNMSLNPARYEAASFASKVFRKQIK